MKKKERTEMNKIKPYGVYISIHNYYSYKSDEK
jgi:hypothetical protein